MSSATKASERSAAFDWGRSVGEVRRANSEPRGTPRGFGLRGGLRDAFLLGLIAGYTAPRTKAVLK